MRLGIGEYKNGVYINLAMNVFLCFAYDNKSKNKRRKQH